MIQSEATKIKKMRKLISKYIKYYVQGGYHVAPVVTWNSEAYIKPGFRNDAYNQVDVQIGHSREYEFTMYNFKLEKLGIDITLDEFKKIFSFMVVGKISFVDCDIPSLGITTDSKTKDGNCDFIVVGPKEVASLDNTIITEITIYNSLGEELDANRLTDGYTETRRSFSSK